MVSKGSSPSTDELDQQHYQRDHQQNMDVGSNCVKADQTNEPKYQQNYKYRPQHSVVPSVNCITAYEVIWCAPQE
jgi:hypothetical protein